jgi:hypothetical protein
VNVPFLLPGFGIGEFFSGSGSRRLHNLSNGYTENACAGARNRTPSRFSRDTYSFGEGSADSDLFGSSTDEDGGNAGDNPTAAYESLLRLRGIIYTHYSAQSIDNSLSLIKVRRMQ